MMIQKTPAYVLTELQMSGKSKTHLLVEGEFDLSFWRNKVSRDVNIICCGGKNNIIPIFQKNKNIPYIILAILDQDYATLCNNWPIIDENVIYTDFNDLETTLFSLGLAQSILNTHCNIEKMKNDNIDHHDDKSIFGDAICIGELRYISAIEGLEIPFERKLSMGKFYKNNEFDKEALYNDFCKCAHISRECLLEKIKQIPQCALWLLVRGHDCIKNIHQIVLKYKYNDVSILKNFNATNAVLLMADEKYKCTKMFREICHWEDKNNINILNKE